MGPLPLPPQAGGEGDFLSRGMAGWESRFPGPSGNLGDARPTAQARRACKERAMSGRPATRLYVTARLAPGAEVELSADQAHRLRAVLRLSTGAAIATFNTADGEWLCRIVELGKNGGRLVVECQLRTAEPEPDLWLL